MPKKQVAKTAGKPKPTPKKAAVAKAPKTEK
jgi:hypothetical protein